MKLTDDCVLWFIYQNNCAKGYSSVISRRTFIREFRVDWSEVESVVEGLINNGLIVRECCWIYGLTSKGLNKVGELSAVMPQDVMVTKRYWEEIAQYLISLYETTHR